MFYARVRFGPNIVERMMSRGGNTGGNTVGHLRPDGSFELVFSSEDARQLLNTVEVVSEEFKMVARDLRRQIAPGTN